MGYYREIPLYDRNCPECGSTATAVCELKNGQERFWHSCIRDECRFGLDTKQQWSKGKHGEVTLEEARRAFDNQHR